MTLPMHQSSDTNAEPTERLSLVPRQRRGCQSLKSLINASMSCDTLAAWRSVPQTSLSAQTHSTVRDREQGGTIYAGLSLWEQQAMPYPLSPAQSHLPKTCGSRADGSSEYVLTKTSTMLTSLSNVNRTKEPSTS